RRPVAGDGTRRAYGRGVCLSGGRRGLLRRTVFEGKRMDRGRRNGGRPQYGMRFEIPGNGAGGGTGPSGAGPHLTTSPAWDQPYARTTQGRGGRMNPTFDAV